MADQKVPVTINFPNQKIANEFMTWLCEQGEQDYWQWAECQDNPEELNVIFDYHKNNVFCPDNTIETHL